MIVFSYLRGRVGKLRDWGAKKEKDGDRRKSEHTHAGYCVVIPAVSAGN